MAFVGGFAPTKTISIQWLRWTAKPSSVLPLPLLAKAEGRQRTKRSDHHGPQYVC
jgi:hypothetical protein